MLVPKLRFKEFYTEWHKIKLKYISNEISYGMNSAATEFDGINKYIRITDIDEESSLYTNNAVSPLGIIEDRFLVKEHDILFARTGASTGKTYLYNKDDGKLFFAGFLIRANIKKQYNSRFIFEQTKLNKYKNWIKIMSIRSGQPGINSVEYGNYEFAITKLEEQNKIADFLNLLNKKIQLQHRKIEALKIYKKGLMNYLFKNSSNTYKVCLKNICIIRKGQQLNKENMSLLGNYYVLNGGSELSGYTNNFNVQENTITISEGGNSCGFVNFNFEKFWAGGHCYILDNISQDVNIYYLYHLLKHNQERIMHLRVGSGLPNIQKKSLENFELSIHNLQSQHYIYKILNSLDSKIDLEINKIKRLNLIKKSLLQQMFI